jgi:hypothetical protein
MPQLACAPGRWLSEPRAASEACATNPPPKAEQTSTRAASDDDDTIRHCIACRPPSAPGRHPHLHRQLVPAILPLPPAFLSVWPSTTLRAHAALRQRATAPRTTAALSVALPSAAPPLLTMALRRWSRAVLWRRSSSPAGCCALSRRAIARSGRIRQPVASRGCAGHGVYVAKGPRDRHRVMR